MITTVMVTGVFRKACEKSTLRELGVFQELPLYVVLEEADVVLMGSCSEHGYPNTSAHFQMTVVLHHITKSVLEQDKGRKSASVNSVTLLTHELRQVSENDTNERATSEHSPLLNMYYIHRFFRDDKTFSCFHFTL